MSSIVLKTTQFVALPMLGLRILENDIILPLLIFLAEGLRPYLYDI